VSFRWLLSLGWLFVMHQDHLYILVNFFFFRRYFSELVLLTRFADCSNFVYTEQLLLRSQSGKVCWQDGIQSSSIIILFKSSKNFFPQQRIHKTLKQVYLRLDVFKWIILHWICRLQDKIRFCISRCYFRRLISLTFFRPRVMKCQGFWMRKHRVPLWETSCFSLN
jgi:hypothetical protein